MMNLKTHKKITFVTNKDDIRLIAKQQLNLVVQRFNTLFGVEAQNINDSLVSGNSDQILENLSGMSDVFSQAITELENCSQLIMSIDPIEENSDQDEKSIVLGKVGQKGAQQRPDGTWEPID